MQIDGFFVVILFKVPFYFFDNFCDPEANSTLFQLVSDWNRYELSGK